MTLYLYVSNTGTALSPVIHDASAGRIKMRNLRYTMKIIDCLNSSKKSLNQYLPDYQIERNDPKPK
jgi:hypothetical protein